MKQDQQRILVIKLDDLSQFVLSLAAMKHIRAAHPKAEITLLTTPPFLALGKACPYFNAVESGGGVTGLADVAQLAWRLKGHKFDRVYDLECSNRSSLIFQLMRPFAPKWSGVALGCAFPHRNPDRKAMHILERQAEQLKIAGIWPDAPTAPGGAPPPDLSWILSREPEARPVAGGVKPRPFVVLVPGGEDGRRWPEERFGELAARFRLAGFDNVVIGVPEHSAFARQIQKSDPKARDLTGRTDFAQIALLGSKAALAVGNESGMLHLIAAAGAPTLALYCSDGRAVFDGPRGHVTVLHADLIEDITLNAATIAAASLLPAPAVAS
ncbi:glycosyltransferase family 9 protein [soil metagenome]